MRCWDKGPHVHIVRGRRTPGCLEPGHPDRERASLVLRASNLMVLT